MRQEASSPRSAALDRLRGAWDRGRRWLAGRGVPTRVALAAAGLAVIGGLGYLASGERAAGPASAPLYEGQRLSSDELAAIQKALRAEAIKCAVDPAAGRVVVRAEKMTAALAAIVKHKAEPATLDELNRDDEPESPWTTPAEREHREVGRLQQTLKRQIEGSNPSILSAQVTIRRERARGTWNARWDVHAYVYLRIEGRRLGPQAVDGIETFLLGAVPDLKPDAITVTDQGGRKYRFVGDGDLKRQAQMRSQEEEWADKIAEGLHHIPGVGVSVILESVAAPVPPAAPLAEAPAAELAVSNHSLRVVDEPPPPLAPAEPPAPRTRANVWVRVPRSWYLLAAQSQAPGRPPSPDDLREMKATTERLAQKAVEVSIPKDLRGEVKVDTVQDDLAAGRTVSLPPDPAESAPAWLVPAVGGGVGLVAVGSLVATGLRLATKRQPGRPDAAWRPGLADPLGPGPAQRVRDLVRANPEAAAGVLQRWIGQGSTAG